MFLKNLFRHLTYQVFSPGTLLRDRYEAFKEVLSNNKESLELIADLESIYHDRKRVDFCHVERKCAQLSARVRKIVENLNRMSPVSYVKLGDYFNKIDFYMRYNLASLDYDISPPFSLTLDEMPPDGEKLAGGKAYRLGQLRRESGLPVPEGFVVTSHAFNYFCEFNDLNRQVADRLAAVDISNASSLEACADELQNIVGDAVIPPAIEEELRKCYSLLRASRGSDVRVAVRSSAVGEDSLTSFAGQYLTILNVGEGGLQEAYKRVIASKFSPRALFYRISNGFLDVETPMAVLFLVMIDARSSGVLYTVDPVASSSGRMCICSVWGLGEPLVEGLAAPDRFEVSRNPDPTVIRKEKGRWGNKVTVSPESGVRLVPLGTPERKRLSIDDAHAQQLASWALKMEDLFTRHLDVEWCLDHSGRLYILQVRPLRVEGPSENVGCALKKAVSCLALLAAGERASSGVGIGTVVKVTQESDLVRVPPGSVLVASAAPPAYAQIADRLCAVVIDEGSIAGHFSSIARELGIPMIVNAKTATQVLKEGETVTVDANACAVYQGAAEELIDARHEKPDIFKESPFMKKLRAALDYISPLHLTDPLGSDFLPERCKSFHDIIRLSHEKAMQEMFSVGRKGSKAHRGARKLTTNLPIILYVVDIGQGIAETVSEHKEVNLEDIENPLFKAVWRGLSHRDIHWSPELLHIDWAELERLSSGGIVNLESPLLASFAVISRDYLNLSIRFGYHFAVVDGFCGPASEENYVMFSFKGGGSAHHGIMLRVKFLVRVLESLGFRMTVRGDLVEAQIKHLPAPSIEEKLEAIGSLLGCTRLMDYVLKDEEIVRMLAEQFLRGDYRFGHLRKRQAPGNG